MINYPVDNAQRIDGLTYTYNINRQSGNKLLKVTDSTDSTQGFNNGTSGTAQDYTYDNNGNMISDRNKDIVKISYNHLNLPTQVKFANSDKINYLYNALGEKAEKVVAQAGINTVTNYLDGFQYMNNQLQFFPTKEGYVSYAQIPELQEVNKLSYIYNYTDPLDYQMKNILFHEDTERSSVRLRYAEDPKNENQLIILEERNRGTRFANTISKIKKEQ